MEQVFEYETSEGVRVRIAHDFFKRNGTHFARGGFQNIRMEGIRIYHDEGSSPKRMQAFDTFWLNAVNGQLTPGLLEEKLRNFADNRLCPEELHAELDGFLGEVETPFPSDQKADPRPYETRKEDGVYRHLRQRMGQN